MFKDRFRSARIYRGYTLQKVADKIRMMLIYAKRKPIDRTRGMRTKGANISKEGCVYGLISRYSIQYYLCFWGIVCNSVCIFSCWIAIDTPLG